MKYEAEIREALIDNAIRKIAEGGFEKATTKELVSTQQSYPFKLNEAYIYRLFGSKENLFEAAFLALDNEFADAVRISIDRIADLKIDTKDKLYEFFNVTWQFILRNEMRCRCYVRYLYSIYFNGRVTDIHKRIWSVITARLTPLFKSEADVVAILHSVFVMILDFGIRVYNGALLDDDSNRPHIFNVLYCMMETYFDKSFINELGGGIV